MGKLPKFTLGFDKSKDSWQLRNGAKHVVGSFETKSKALKGGVLQTTVGAGGGSVQIRRQDGTIQEERTYPRSADPKRSPG